MHPLKLRKDAFHKAKSRSDKQKVIKLFGNPCQILFYLMYLALNRFHDTNRNEEDIFPTVRTLEFVFSPKMIVED